MTIQFAGQGAPLAQASNTPKVQGNSSIYVSTHAPICRVAFFQCYIVFSLCHAVALLAVPSVAYFVPSAFCLCKAWPCYVVWYLENGAPSLQRKPSKQMKVRFTDEEQQIVDPQIACDFLVDVLRLRDEHGDGQISCASLPQPCTDGHLQKRRTADACKSPERSGIASGYE